MTLVQGEICLTGQLANIKFVWQDRWLRGHLTNMTSDQQDIWPTGHLTNRTFDQQDIWPTGHLTNRTFDQQDIWPTEVKNTKKLQTLKLIWPKCQSHRKQVRIYSNSTLVEHLVHNPMAYGSNHSPSTSREKIANKFYKIDLGWPNQGYLTEREGLVRLVSLY
jgi:hypothetical protein